nr:MAG TPA: hypothetical protein [Bacteriophage sp.]
MGRIAYLPCLTTAAYHRYAKIKSNNFDNHIKQKNCRAHLLSSSSPIFVFSEPCSNDSFWPTSGYPPLVISPLTPGRACALDTVTIIRWDASILSYSRQPHFSGWVPQARYQSPCPRIGVTSETGKFKSLPNINRLPSY